MSWHFLLNEQKLEQRKQTQQHIDLITLSRLLLYFLTLKQSQANDKPYLRKREGLLQMKASLRAAEVGNIPH